MAKEPTASAQDRFVYTLRKPVTYNGETVSEIAYRAATGRDMRKALNTPQSGDRYIGLMVDLCERPAQFFDALSGPDFMALTDCIDVFFERPRKT